MSDKQTWLNLVEKKIHSLYGLDRNDWIDSVQDGDWEQWIASDWIDWYGKKYNLKTHEEFKKNLSIPLILKNYKLKR